MAGNSKHMQVRDAVMAALQPVAPGLVKPGRNTPMAEQDAKLIKVYLDTAQIERAEFKGQPDDWATRVRIEFHARGTDADSGETISDAMATAGYALVAVDPSLGVDAIDCIPVGLAWSNDDADTSIGVTQAVWEVKHRTPSADISA